MRIIYDLNEWKEQAVVATIGFFDGVHRGHRFLLQALKREAEERRLPSAVVTFPVHPRVVMQSEYQPKLLNSLEEKLALLSETGVDYGIVMDFTGEIAGLPARAFIRDILSARWHVKTLLIGYDHRFGRQLTDGFEQYVAYGAECGMEIVKASSFTAQGVTVSSSDIRRRLESGDVQGATGFLGYRYRLRGRVVEGCRVGRSIGFPTANLALDDPCKALPRNGSYAVWVVIDDKQYKGMLYIGSRPTLEKDSRLSIEVHIFDFSGDVYHQTVTVEFVDFIREDQKFDSLNELKSQMQKDKMRALHLLTTGSADVPSASTGYADVPSASIDVMISKLKTGVCNTPLHIMEQFYDAIDILKGMIVIPSFSREEEAVADFLQSHWTKAGYVVNRQGHNLWISSLIDQSKPTLLLNSHIDTVRPGCGEDWSPFVADDSQDDLLFGLGSNDAGASVVSLYEAFTILYQREQSYNLIFLVSAEEEVSGSGGLTSVLPCLPDISFAVVGEPTGMQPAVAEKGLMVLDCIATGKAGHAARNEGVNAISLAIRDIDWFHTFQFPEKSDWLGTVKMSVTQIQAGTQHNVIPDCCKFVVDVRSNELYSNEALLLHIREHVCSEVVPRSLRLNSSRTDIHHPFVQRAIMLGKKPFGSPTLSDQALMPFPSVKIGPGDSARSHITREYVRLSEIREAINEYVMLLDGLIF